MDPEVIEKLLNKKWVGEQLRLFRLRYCPHLSLAEFQREAGITGLQRVEQGYHFPSWKTLVKVGVTCRQRPLEVLGYLHLRASTRGVFGTL
jgi:hypothetical protein